MRLDIGTRRWPCQTEENWRLKNALRRWDEIGAKNKGEKKKNEKLGNLFDIRVIPHKMYFNIDFFFRCLFFFSVAYFFSAPPPATPSENIKKVMHRSVSFCVRRQISSLRMLNSACSLSASYVTTLYFFAILLLSRHRRYEFTRPTRIFLRNLFKFLCDNTKHVVLSYTIMYRKTMALIHVHETVYIMHLIVHTYL